jgi:uncharacterized membrane protein YphA (DoxX/SURF4 family)
VPDSLFRRALPVILRVLLTLGFLAAGLSKFAPQSGWQARFAGWGYPAWFVLVIGALEVVGVLGLWVPAISRYAIGLLAVILLGATYTNLTHPPIIEAVRPVVFLAVLATLFATQQTRPNFSPPGSAGVGAA